MSKLDLCTTESLQEVQLFEEEVDAMFDNIITLTDEQGREVQFDFLDLIEYKDDEYVVLLPVEDPDDECAVVILKIDSSEENAEEESYSSVEDESELQAVFEMFCEKFKEEFTFIE